LFQKSYFALSNNYAREGKKVEENSLKIRIHMGEQKPIEKKVASRTVVPLSRLLAIMLVIPLLTSSVLMNVQNVGPTTAGWLQSKDPPSYVFQSDFPSGNVSVLSPDYWIANPAKEAGSYGITNGILQITATTYYQIGFGMTWNKPGYQYGWESKGWVPWLPLYWHYHSESTFTKDADGKIPDLAVENWISWVNGSSITAMVFYLCNNELEYSLYPNVIPIANVNTPSTFTLIIDADYVNKILTINLAGHQFVEKLGIEPIGTIPYPFSSFQISLFSPGTIYLQNLHVEYSRPLKNNVWAGVIG
jgi:hypothetical protein